MNSNARIKGSFTKQQWGGRKGDDAIHIGTVEFDATDTVLLMDLQEIHELEDHDESTDEIGRDHVEWNGPCEVTITQSICHFFGVEDLDEIDEEMLAEARTRIQPKPVEARTIRAVVEVRVLVTPGGVADWADVLKLSVASESPGVVARSSRLVSTELLA